MKKLSSPKHLKAGHEALYGGTCPVEWEPLTPAEMVAALLEELRGEVDELSDRVDAQAARIVELETWVGIGGK